MAGTFKAVHMPASDQSLHDVSWAWQKIISPVRDPAVVSCASSRMCVVGAIGPLGQRLRLPPRSIARCPSPQGC